MSFRITAVFSLLFFAVSVNAKPMNEVIGSTHVDGKYFFTSTDFLNEGADQIRSMGSRVIKVWFNDRAATSYPWNSVWPVWNASNPFTLVKLAQTSYYQTLFSKDFKTFVLLAEDPDVWFGDGMTAAEVQAETNNFKNLTLYLMETYRGTGKTFVLQTWEGDNQLRFDTPDGQEPPPERAGYMITWLNARQDGVDAGRAAAAAEGITGVTVYNAAEVNHVVKARQGIGITMTNNVIPSTHCDLYSYSAWDSVEDPALFRLALDYLESKAPNKLPFNKYNIYVGEYGKGEDPQGDGIAEKEVVRRATEVALGWGVQYILYWEVYDNTGTQSANGNGFWLRRRDGSYPPMYSYFADLLQKGYDRVTFLSSNGYYVVAENGGSDVVNADRLPPAGIWETFTLIDLNGNTLASGDHINLLSTDGHYVVADLGASNRVYANRNTAGTWEDFVISSTNGSPSIAAGTPVSLQSSASSLYVVAEGGGGPGTAGVWANRQGVGAWETFTFGNNYTN